MFVYFSVQLEAAHQRFEGKLVRVTTRQLVVLQLHSSEEKSVCASGSGSGSGSEGKQRCQLA